MRILRSRLAELPEEEREAELARERGSKVDVGFGSQIRSYVLHPYQMVKDHRTDYEVGNAQGVLDGALDGFVQAYLLARRRQGLAGQTLASHAKRRDAVATATAGAFRKPRRRGPSGAARRIPAREQRTRLHLGEPRTGAPRGPACVDRSRPVHGRPAHTRVRFRCRPARGPGRRRERLEAGRRLREAMIVFEDVRKVYEPDVVALDRAAFVIEKGEFVFVVGPPGRASRRSSGSS